MPIYGNKNQLNVSLFRMILTGLLTIESLTNLKIFMALVTGEFSSHGHKMGRYLGKCCPCLSQRLFHESSFDRDEKQWLAFSKGY